MTTTTQVCKTCAFRCHAELATAIYLSNNIPTITADAHQMQQHRTRLLHRLTTHIAPPPPHIPTFDAFRDTEAAGAFAQPTTLTNPFFASPLPFPPSPQQQQLPRATAANAEQQQDEDNDDNDSRIIHNAHHVANNTLAYRNRLREQQHADTQRLHALRASLKRTVNDLRLLDRAAKERATALQLQQQTKLQQQQLLLHHYLPRSSSPSSAAAAEPAARPPPASSSSPSSSNDNDDNNNNDRDHHDHHDKQQQQSRRHITKK
jgi:hypothetical protein